MKTIKNITLAASVLLAGASTNAIAQDGAVSMTEAIEVAVATNPQVIEAQMNTEAIQFEREQAQGQFYPRVDLEGSGGIRRLENPTRRNLGIADDELYPLEARARLDWMLLDGGQRKGELLRQAARVDGASLRVVERSEFVALQVARQYLDVLLQERVVAASVDNVAFHQSLVNDLGTGVSQGSISVADQQQAEERLQSALVRQAEAEQALQDARISLRSLTGLDINQVTLPPDLGSNLPAGVDQAIGDARTRNPLVREAQADVDAANAMVTSAKGELYPTFGVELTGRYGEDIDGFQGRTEDLQARGYVRWTIFDGGIRAAQVQEMVRRSSEQRYRMHQRVREAEEDVRMAWNAKDSQANIVSALSRQSQVADDLLLSYRSQFNVGRRSLLDVLDSQNTRYNTQVRLETARFSETFAEYQVLAATNRFLDALNVAPGTGAGANERERFEYGPPTPAELQRRRYAR